MAGVLAFDEYEVDRARSELRRGGHPVKVDALVIELLAYLASRPGELITHEELIEHVWGGRAVSDNVVSVCVAKLRKALGHRRGERELIINVYGRGYRFLPVVRERSRISEPPRPALEVVRLAAPFVGRELITARLVHALAAARERRGSVCALIGEPGIGKTRLAESLEQHAVASGMPAAWGRARELDGAPPFWPWAEVLRAALASVSTETAAKHLGSSFIELSRVLPELRPPAGLQGAGSGDAAPYRTFDAIARLLALAGQDEPWLLVLDDMHRADAASLELLCYLVDEIARLPVVIVVTLRSTELRRAPAERRHIEYLLGHRNCERIEVAPLALRDVQAYTDAFLGRQDEALAQAVFEKSEGNAFFMTELLRELAEVLATEEPERTQSRIRRELLLPPAALDLIRQRVRRVGDEALPFLKIAAVLGRSFDLGLLARVAQVPAATLLESLDHALATDVLVAAPEGLARFAFAHDLIRAVLYDGLPKCELAALHLKVALALAESERDGRDVPPAELAHHFLSALPHGDPVRAAQYGERAAEAAMSVAAYADGAAILRRAQGALDLADEPQPVLRCRLHFRTSICLRVSDARESIAELRRAVALARNTQQHRLLALAGQAMVRAPGVVMVEDCRSVLEDALAGLAEDDHALRSTTLAHLAWCSPYCFDRGQVEALGERALYHARLAQSRPAQIAALRTQIHLGAGPCRPDSETRRLLDEADQLAAQEGHQQRVSWRNQASSLRASIALQRGDQLGVEQALEALSKSARDLRHAELIWHSDRMRVIHRMNQGFLSDAAQLLRELRARAKAMQLFAYELVCSQDFLVLLRQTTDLRDPSISLSSLAQPAPQDSPGVLAIKLRAAVDMHKTDVARQVFDELCERGFERLPCDRDYLGVLSHLTRAAVMLGSHDWAKRLLSLLAPHAGMFSSDISFHSDGAVDHALGLLARFLGDRAQALSWFRAAIVANERVGMRARVLDSRFELASTLLAGGVDERCAARDLLVTVESSARALSMAPLAARAGQLVRS